MFLARHFFKLGDMFSKPASYSTPVDSQCCIPERFAIQYVIGELDKHLKGVEKTDDWRASGCKQKAGLGKGFIEYGYLCHRVQSQNCKAHICTLP